MAQQNNTWQHNNTWQRNNTWHAELTYWLTNDDLWVLADSQRPTHRSGTVDDAMLLAVGSYLPEGVLPGDAEKEKALENA